jgi:anti-sigma factor RsiW
MRPELETMQRLESYLRGSLDEDQRVEVEVRLLWDREWQDNLAAQQTAYRALREAGRQRLRQQLRTIHTRLFG